MSSVYSRLESSQKEFFPSKTWYDFVDKILDGQLERQAHMKGNKLEYTVLHLALCFPAGQCTADSNISHCITFLFVYHGADLKHSEHATLI